MTIKELTEKYESETLERLKNEPLSADEHSDYDWDAWNEGYLASASANIADAYESGFRAAFAELAQQLKDYDKHDRISLYWLRYVISQILGEKS